VTPMRKIAFVFAGQGAQYVGMGTSFYNEPFALELINKYPNVAEICQVGPQSELDKTSNTQAAIVFTSLLALKALQYHGIVPAIAAGLSLGEYTACFAAGIFSEDELMEIAFKRGQWMEETVQGMDCRMTAVLQSDNELIHSACNEASAKGIVSISNFNCQGQTVISGERSAVDQAVELLKEMGVRRLIDLQVSGPFHTALMAPVENKLTTLFETITFNPMTFPVLCNLSGSYVSDNDLRHALIKQVSSAVQFAKTIETLRNASVTTVIEIGPKTVLSGFIKKSAWEVELMHVEDMDSLQETLHALKGESV